MLVVLNATNFVEYLERVVHAEEPPEDNVGINGIDINAPRDADGASPTMPNAVFPIQIVDAAGLRVGQHSVCLRHQLEGFLEGDGVGMILVTLGVRGKCRAAIRTRNVAYLGVVAKAEHCVVVHMS